MVPYAEYGIGIFCVASLLWVVKQVFLVIQNNTKALQELIVLIREQSSVVKDLAYDVLELKLKAGKQ